MAEIRGEYWIQNGHVDFADGDVGDKNHEGIAIEHVFYKYADQIVAFADANEIDTTEAHLYGEVNVEGLTDIIAHLRNKFGDQAVMTEIGADPDAYDVLLGVGDAHAYVLIHEGWIAVRANNAELYGWNAQKKDELASGLGDIVFEEGIEEPPEEIEFSIHDFQSQKYFMMTLADLEGQPVRLQQPPTTTYNNKFLQHIPGDAENYFPPKKTTPPPGKYQAWWRVASESTSFRKWLKDELWIESVNANLMTNLIQRLKSERDQAIAQGGTGGKSVTLDTQEYSELQNVINVVKEKIVQMLQAYSADWNVYKKWFEQHGAKAVQFTHFGKLAPIFQIGPQTAINGETLYCRRDFYNLLTWREWVKDLASLSQSPIMPMINISSLLQGLQAVKVLVK
jgi:hypothetical protein